MGRFPFLFDEDVIENDKCSAVVLREAGSCMLYAVIDLERDLNWLLSRATNACCRKLRSAPVRGSSVVHVCFLNDSGGIFKVIDVPLRKTFGIAQIQRLKRVIQWR